MEYAAGPKPTGVLSAIHARMAAARRRHEHNFRVEFRLVGCDSSIMRHFATLGDASECYHRERVSNRGQLVRLVLSEHDGGQWVVRSSVSPSVESRRRDLEFRSEMGQKR